MSLDALHVCHTETCILLYGVEHTSLGVFDWFITKAPYVTILVNFLNKYSKQLSILYTVPQVSPVARVLSPSSWATRWVTLTTRQAICLVTVWTRCAKETRPNTWTPYTQTTTPGMCTFVCALVQNRTCVTGRPLITRVYNVTAVRKVLCILKVHNVPLSYLTLENFNAWISHILFLWWHAMSNMPSSRQ